MPAYTHHDEGVTVPNVTRLSLENAQQMLQSSGLDYVIAKKRSNEAFPAGYVIEQYPEPFHIVKPGRTIYLSVNVISHPTVKMPDLTNLSLRNARIQLKNANLQIGTISYQSGRFKNTVLHQSIDPGTIVKRGTAVDMLVSNGLGKKKVTVPDIVGLKLTKAEQLIRKNNLRVGQIRYKPSSNTAPNVVLDYYPNVQKAIVGSTLQLIVSELPGAKQLNLIFQKHSSPDTSYSH